MTHAFLIFFVFLSVLCGASGCSEDVSRDEPSKVATGTTPVVQPEEVHGGKALDGSPLPSPKSLAVAEPAPAPAAGTHATPVPAATDAPVSVPTAQTSPASPSSAPAQPLHDATPLDAVKKLVLVVAPDWNANRAEVSLYSRDSFSSPWKRLGNPSPCMVGRNGLAWGRGLAEPHSSGPRKKEGDGKTPAGLFPLPLAFGYEPQAKASQAGIRLPYLALAASTVCVTDPDSAAFNDLADSKNRTAAWTRQDR
ncbi:MAG: hypothetical protein V3572_02165, partial [Desulfolutivibrio sp.]